VDNGDEYLRGDGGMKKRLLIAGMAVILLGALGYAEFLRGTAQKYDFRFDKLTEGAMSVYVTATGTISAVISVDVGTQVSGIITITSLSSMCEMTISNSCPG
jgi:multidrug efflux pump subunit AcrA (membrane-fusion protein)